MNPYLEEPYASLPVLERDRAVRLAFPEIDSEIKASAAQHLVELKPPLPWES